MRDELKDLIERLHKQDEGIREAVRIADGSRDKPENLGTRGQPLVAAKDERLHDIKTELVNTHIGDVTSEVVTEVKLSNLEGKIEGMTWAFLGPGGLLDLLNQSEEPVGEQTWRHAQSAPEFGTPVVEEPKVVDEDRPLEATPVAVPELPVVPVVLVPAMEVVPLEVWERLRAMRGDTAVAQVEVEPVPGLHEVLRAKWAGDAYLRALMDIHPIDELPSLAVDKPKWLYRLQRSSLDKPNYTIWTPGEDFAERHFLMGDGLEVPVAVWYLRRPFSAEFLENSAESWWFEELVEAILAAVPQPLLLTWQPEVLQLTWHQPEEIPPIAPEVIDGEFTEVVPEPPPIALIGIGDGLHMQGSCTYKYEGRRAKPGTAYLDLPDGRYALIDWPRLRTEQTDPVPALFKTPMTLPEGGVEGVLFATVGHLPTSQLINVMPHLFDHH